MEEEKQLTEELLSKIAITSELLASKEEEISRKRNDYLRYESILQENEEVFVEELQ